MNSPTQIVRSPHVIRLLAERKLYHPSSPLIGIRAEHLDRIDRNPIALEIRDPHRHPLLTNGSVHSPQPNWPSHFDFDCEAVFAESAKPVGRFHPRQLVHELKQDSTLNRLYSSATTVETNKATAQKYYVTLERHILLVIQQFERYFAHKYLPADFSRALFRFMLAVHDIGKPEAVRTNLDDKSREHHYTLPLVENLCRHMGVSESDISVIKALINNNSLGPYMASKRMMLNLNGSNEHIYRKYIPRNLGYDVAKTADVIKSLNTKNYADCAEKAQRYTRAAAIKTIRRQAAICHLPVADFFDLLMIYYQCDLSAYTHHATGIPHAFDGYFHSDFAQRQLGFRDVYGEHMENLEREIKAEF